MAGLPDVLRLNEQASAPELRFGSDGVVMRVGARVRSATTRHEFDTPGPAVNYGCPTFIWTTKLSGRARNNLN
jgi:hypothetical protein